MRILTMQLAELDDHVGSTASGSHEAGIHLVAAQRPAPRVVRRLSVGRVTRDQPLDTQLFVDFDVPRFIE